MTAVIPAFEPTDRLLDVVCALARTGFARRVVVDDGSGPAFAACFERVAAAGCTVIRRPANGGKGLALKDGLRAALAEERCRGIVTVDADGQHAAEDCRRVAEALEGAPEALVLGQRPFALGSMPFRSWWGNRWTAWEFALVRHRWVPDTQTGLRAFGRAAAQWMLDLPQTGYEFEMAVLCTAARCGMPFVRVPIARIYEDGNATSHFSPWRDTVRIHRVLYGFKEGTP